MIVVSDTSPINNLAAIGHLQLLRKLYGQVIIPEAVYSELVSFSVAGAEEVKTFDWILVRSVDDRELVSSFIDKGLDVGESEAIALAIELEAERILMDETIGRGVAKEQGLALTGVVGVLVKAKDCGLIKEVKSLLDRLRDPVNFWISDALYQRVLEAAEE